MAVKLPKHTWAADTIGGGTVVYSTVTGNKVGEIKDGKFVQTVDKIPQPTTKRPRTVTVPTTARAGGIENTIAGLERDAMYFRSVAEDIDNSAQERADARRRFDGIQSQLALLKGQQQEAKAGMAQEQKRAKSQDARGRAAEIKDEYERLIQEKAALFDQTDPKAQRIENQMRELAKEYRGVYSDLVGAQVSLSAAMANLTGVDISQMGGARAGTYQAAGEPVTGGAPTGTVTPRTGASTQRPETGGDLVYRGGASVTPDLVYRGGSSVQNLGGKPDNVPMSTAPGVFDPARFRMGEERSMGATVPTIPTAPGAVPMGPPKTLDELLTQTENWFSLPDYIFRLDKDLGNLLIRAVQEKWTEERWDKEIENTNWWRKNSDEVRRRIVQYGNYKDLQSQGQDVSRSDYGIWLRNQKNNVKAQARQIAGVALTDAQAEEIASKIWNGFLDNDALAVRALIVPYIGTVRSIVGNGIGGEPTIAGYSGEALRNFQTLQAIAKANGFTLRDILPSISTATTGGNLEEAVLEKLALGELDMNRIAQDARMLAAQGQPQYVRDLLNQGYDLQTVYAPYRNIMSNVLELNAEEIDLNDATLRSAITDKGDANIYDFKKALRQDPRWEYTSSARQEVGDSVMTVLRNFGFQG